MFKVFLNCFNNINIFFDFNYIFELFNFFFYLIKKINLFIFFFIKEIYNISFVLKNIFIKKNYSSKKFNFYNQKKIFSTNINNIKNFYIF